MRLDARTHALYVSSIEVSNRHGEKVELENAPNTHYHRLVSYEEGMKGVITSNPQNREVEVMYGGYVLAIKPLLKDKQLVGHEVSAKIEGLENKVTDPDLIETIKRNSFFFVRKIAAYHENQNKTAVSKNLN